MRNPEQFNQLESETGIMVEEEAPIKEKKPGAKKAKRIKIFHKKNEKEERMAQDYFFGGKLADAPRIKEIKEPEIKIKEDLNLKLSDLAEPKEISAPLFSKSKEISATEEELIQDFTKSGRISPARQFEKVAVNPKSNIFVRINSSIRKITGRVRKFFGFAIEDSINKK